MHASDHPAADAPELQFLVTRYVDSVNGYRQAARQIPGSSLAAAFIAIAERRDSVAERLAGLLFSEEDEPEKIAPRTEIAGPHRWWARLHERVTAPENDAVLAECARGEKELSVTLRGVLGSFHLKPVQAMLIAEAAAEVELTARTLEASVAA